MIAKGRFIILFFLVVFSSVGYAQTMSTASHETDDQLQVTVNFDSPPSGNAADYILDGGSIGVSSVFVSGNTAFLTLSAAVPIGTSSFSVEYDPTGQTINSENNRIITCNDFRYFGQNTPADECAAVEPTERMVFEILPGARNSSNYDISDFFVRARWGSPGDPFSDLAVFESDNTGNASANTNFVSVDAALDTYTYPANDPVCSYDSRWLFAIRGVGICPVFNAQQFITYASHNEDNEGDGVLALDPTVANTDLVCLNDEVNMSFSDVSTLNCIADPTEANTEQRWVRVIYGDVTRPDTDRIPNVYVGGVQVTDDNGALIAGEYIPTFGGGTGALGTGDVIGVVSFATPATQLPFGALDAITSITTATGQLNRDIGDRFYVRIEYWNKCNAYSIGNPSSNQVSISDFIEIIDIPPTPTAVNNEICEGSGTGGVDFQIAGTAGSTAINWYDDDPNAGGVDITGLNGDGNNSTTFPVNDLPAFDNNTPGDYSVWATYVIGATNSCESDPVETTVTVRDDLNQPDAITGTSPICNNTNGVAFSLPNPAGSTPFGGNAEYQWQSTGGGGVTLSSNTGQNITADFAIGGSFTTVTRNIRVRRRYVNNPRCNSPWRTFTVTIFGETLGGTTSSDNTICEGDNSGVITLSGHRGTILNWERSVNSGPFVDIGNNGNTTFSQVLATAGTYEYRAVIDNGPCNTENSSVTTIEVNPIPSKPTITEVGDGLTICENGDQTILQSSNSGGDADEYQWFKDPDLITPVQGPSGSNQLILNSVAESGRYYVQTIGINPTDCESAISDPIDVVINPLPTATVSGGGSVCAGNPAPDIVWTMTGTAPYDFTITLTPGANIVETGYASNTYTISSPNPGVNTDYEMTALQDANGCNATSMGGVASVAVIATAPPSIDSFTPGAAVCDDGATTTAPQLTLDLAPNSVQTYDITFSIFDSSPALVGTQTINRTTDAAGVTTIDPDYVADLGQIPDTYEFRITSIVNTGTGCNASGLPASQFITINPRPADPTNPVDAIACSTDATGATISVDDPGVGFVVRWYTAYTDEITNTPAIGTTGGTRDETFTPTSNATQTYLAVIESTTAPTNCHSNNAIAVEHTQDLEPSAADADFDDDPEFLETCDDQLVLGATAADNGGTGTWSAPGLLFSEDFESLADGTVSDNDLFGWTIDISATSMVPPDHFEVRSGAFEANDTDGVAIWESNPIDISSIANFDISVDAFESTNNDANDWIELYYQIDANPEQQVGARLDGNFTSGTISGSAATGGGSQLTIRIKVDVRADADALSFDNVRLVETGADPIAFVDANDPNTTVSGLQIGTTTLTWTVSSALGACNNSSGTVDVTRHPLPVANNLTPELCEDLPQGSDLVAGVDLTSYAAALVAPANLADRSILYFDAPARNNPADLIATPANYDISNGEIIYVTITDEATSAFPSNYCSQDATITFTVNTLPDAIDQDNTNPETVFCEQSVGSADKDDIDLTTLDDNVSNSAADRSVEWFFDPGGVVTTRADLTGNEVATPTDVDNVTNGDLFYAIVVNDLTLCEDIAEVEITVNPRPINNPIIAPDGSTPASVTVCRSNNVLFFQVDPALNPGTTYTWTVPTAPGELELVGGGGVNDFFVLVRAPNTIASPGVTLSVVETSADGCTGNTNSIDIIVDDAPPAPTINGNQEVCENQSNVTYSIASPIVGSTYTWNIGSLGSIVSGQGTSSIIVNIGTTSDNITVTETSSAGCTSPAAAPYPVTVNPRPNMTSASTATLCSGEQVDTYLTFTSDVGSTTYDWVVLSKTGSVGGATVGNTGSGNITQTLTNTSGAPGSVTYEVTPTGPAPANCVGATQVVTISVNTEPVGVNATSNECSDVALSYDLQNNITVSGNNVASDFTWVAAANPNVTGESTTPQAGDFITDNINNVTGANEIVSYTVSPVAEGTGCPGSDFTINITINSEPVGVADASTVCAGVSVGYDLQSNVNTLGNSMVSNFSWVATANANVTGESTTPQAGATINDVLTNTTGADEIVTYTVTPTDNTNNCVGDDFVITITVQSEPVGAADVATTCSDIALAYDLQNNVNTLGNSMASNFSWVATANANVTGESTTPQAGATITDVLTNTTGADETVIYTVTPTETTNGCVGNDFIITVTVQSEPVGAADGVTTCSDVVLSYDLQNNVNTLGNSMTSNFSWVATANANVTGESTTPQAGATINDVLTNITGADETVTYTVTPTDNVNGCLGNDFVITVTVQSEPVGVSEATSVCSDIALAYDLQNNVNTLGNSMASNFSWVATANANVTGESTTPQAGATINDVLTNTTGADETVTYTVTPTENVNGCVGNDFVITVTVQSEPVGAADAATTCSDVALTYDLQNNVNTLGNSMASNFSWVATANANVSGESTAPQAGATINDVLTNTTGADETVTYTVTPTDNTNGCVGNDFIITVTVQSEPRGANDVVTECSNIALSYDLQANVNSPSGNSMDSDFSWVAVDNPSVTGESLIAQAGDVINDVIVNTSATDQIVVYTVTPSETTNGCVGNDFTITVTVGPEPLGVAENISICSDIALTYDLQNNINTLGNGRVANFSWVATANANVTGESTTPQAGATINDVLTNTTGADETVTYTVTPTDNTNGCVGNDFIITVTVQSEPVGVPDAATTCSDVALVYDLQNNVNTLGNSMASNFSWVATANANVTGESTTPQAGATINDILTNTTGVDETVIYTVTPTETTNGCVGNDFIITVTVQSEPVGVAEATSVCSDVALTYDLQNNVNTLGNSMASNFSWIATANANVTGESTAPQAGATINDVLTNTTGADETVTYTVTPTDNVNGCVGNDFVITVTVQSEPVGAADVATTCSDVALTYDLQNNVNTLGNSLASNFSWVATANANVTGESTTPQAGATINDVLTNTTGADETVTYTVTPTDNTNGCVGNDFVITVTVQSEPVGVSEATSVCSDIALAYDLQNNVNTLGNSMASNFSWVATSNANVTGESTTPQAGATINDVLTNTTGADEIVTYTVTPTDNTNGCVGNDFIITVTVQSEPVGVAEATSVCSDVALSYDLQNNVNTLGNSMASNFSWVATANANVTGESTTPQAGATINDVLTNTTGADETVTYTVTPTDNTNGCVGNDFVITVTVQSEPVGVADADITCSDVSLAYNLQNNVNTLGNSMASNFSWVATANANVTGESTTPQAGATINDVLTNTTGADETITYTVTPTDNTNGCVGDDFVITVTVQSEPVGVADADITCSDVALAYDLQNNVNTLGNNMASNFSWVATANANVTGESTTPQAGATINDVLTNTTGADETVTYTVTPTETANGCVGNPFIITVTVQSEPRGANDVLSECSDVALAYDLQANINSPSGNSMDSDFSWIAADNPSVTGESLVPQSGDIINDVITNTSTTDQTVVYTVTPTETTNGCVGNDFTITVTIRAEPLGVDDTKAICSNTTTLYDLQNNINTLGNNRTSNFSWAAADNPNVTGESTTPQALTVINDLLRNFTNVDQDVVYTVTPTGINGCVGNPFDITITVQPEPLGANDTDVECSDIMLTYDLQNNVNSLGNGVSSDFTWTAASNPSVTGESTTPQAGDIINDVITNTTGVDQIVTYTVTPTDDTNGCVGADFTVDITVNSEPRGQNDTEEVCSDVALTFDLQNNVNSLGNGMASNFIWIAADNPNVTGESTTPQGGSTIIDAITNTTGADEVVVYTVTPTDGTNACVGNDFIVTVTVHSEPVGVADVATTCSDVALTYNLQNNVNTLGNNMASTFSWVATPNASVGGESTTAQSGGTINDVLTNQTSVDQTVTYTVTPTDATDNCVGDPFTITVTVQSEPTASNDTYTECSDVAIAYDLQNNVDVFGNGMTSNFDWIATDNPNVSGESLVIQSSGTISDVLTNNSGVDQLVNYTVTPTETANGCVGDDFVIAVTVLSEPLGVNDTDNECSDVPLSYNLQNNINSLGNGMAASFSWVATPNANVTGESTTPQTGAIISDVITNISGADEVVTYTATPTATSNTCLGDPFTIDITIHSEPVGANDTDNYCSDVAIAYDLQNNVNTFGNSMPSTFTWVAANNAFVTGESTTIQSGSVINDVITNQTASSQNVVYTVTPTETGDLCVGNNFTITVTIDPEPVMDPALATANICSNSTNNPSTTGIVFQNNGSSVVPTDYDISLVSQDAGLTGTPTTGTGLADNAIQNDSYVNVTSIPLDVVYQIIPNNGACPGDAFNITVTVDPMPVVNPSLDAVGCSDEDTGIILSTNGTSVAAGSYRLDNVTIPVGLSADAGNAVIGATGGTNLIQGDSYTNQTNASIFVTYDIIPISVGPLACEGETETFQFEVLPEPVFDSSISPAPVCSDTPLGVMLGVEPTSVAADSYDIIAVNPDAGLTPVVTTTGNGLAANAIVNDRYINVNSTFRDVRYTVRPVTAGCEGDNFILTVRINPAPDLADLDAIVCSNEVSGISLGTTGASAPASDYRIVSVTPDPALTVVFQTADNTTTSDVNEIAADQYINNTDNPLDVLYEIVPISGAACEGPQETVTLTVEPEPTMTVPPNENICNEDLTSITLNSTTVPTAGNVTFDVQALPIGAVTGAPFLRQNLSNGFIIEDELRNLGTTVAEIQYTITPKIVGAKNGIGCTAGTPTVVSVFVEPEPSGTFNQSFVTICEGESLDDLDNFITTTKTPSGAGMLEYELTNVFASDPAVTGFSATGLVLNTSAPNNELTDVINIGAGITSNQTVTYQFTPRIVGSDAGTCVGAAESIELIVSVRPRAEVTPSETNVELCSGESREILLPTDVDNSIATWTVADNPNVDGEFSGLGSRIFLSLINNSTIPQTLEYIVTPISLFDPACSGPQRSIFVTVNPIPDVVVADAEIQRCDGDGAGIVLNGNIPNSRFEWTATVLAGSVNFGAPGASGSGTNGDIIDHTVTNTGTTQAIIRYEINAFFDKTLGTGLTECEGFIPGFVTMTLSPPVSASIVPDPDVGTGTRFRCVGDAEGIRFNFTGAPPFTLTLEKTDANGVITTETLDNLPSQHIILAQETVSYDIEQIEDVNGCIATSADRVDIVFEDALADFEVRGADANNTFAFTKSPPVTNLDFNSGTATIEFRINNYIPQNTYVIQVGDSTFEAPGAIFQYTFTEPSPQGTLGFTLEMQVETPNAFNCNDVENFFIQVEPASPVVIGCIGDDCNRANSPDNLQKEIEGCPPLNVDFNSYIEDGSGPFLSRNIQVENLQWDFGDGTGNTANAANTSYTFTRPGSYQVTITGTNGYGEFATDQLTVIVYDQPTAIVQSNQEVVYIPDDPFKPINRSVGADRYRWDFGDNTDIETGASPQHFYDLPGEYTVILEAFNDENCSDTTSVTVNVEEGGFTKTPNAFTPSLNGPSGGVATGGSGSALNDVFLPITQGVEEFRMIIFDRWGNLVFESNDKNIGWDGYNSKGKLLPAGVYVYKLELTLSNGQRSTRVGDVTLIR